MNPLLDGGLFGPGRGARLTPIGQLFLHPQLALGEAAGLAQGLVDRFDHLPAPLLLHLPPPLLQPVAQGRQRARGLLTLLPGLGTLAPLGGLGRLLHFSGSLPGLLGQVLHARGCS